MAPGETSFLVPFLFLDLVFRVHFEFRATILAPLFFAPIIPTCHFEFRANH